MFSSRLRQVVLYSLDPLFEEGFPVSFDSFFARAGLIDDDDDDDERERKRGVAQGSKKRDERGERKLRGSFFFLSVFFSPSPLGLETHHFFPSRCAISSSNEGAMEADMLRCATSENDGWKEREKVQVKKRGRREGLRSKKV